MKSAISPEIGIAVKDFFSSKTGVLLVFVFGSAAEGRLTAHSDIDIAVLLKNDIDKLQIHKMAQERRF